MSRSAGWKRVLLDIIECVQLLGVRSSEYKPQAEPYLLVLLYTKSILSPFSKSLSHNRGLYSHKPSLSHSPDFRSRSSPVSRGCLHEPNIPFQLFITANQIDGSSTVLTWPFVDFPARSLILLIMYIENSPKKFIEDKSKCFVCSEKFRKKYTSWWSQQWIL